MPSDTRYQEQKRKRDALATPVDDDSSSGTEEPPTKKKRMTKDQQITALQQLTKSHEATIKKQAQMIDTRDNKIDGLEVMIENLKRQQKRKQVGVPENKALKLVVKTYTTSHVWTWYKFIADEDELDEIMERILLSCEDGVKILSKVDGADKQEARKELLRSYSLTYGPDICKAINGKRSTTQSALYKAVMDRLKEKKRVPKPKTFLKIIRRKGLQYRTEEGADGPTPDVIEVVDSNREVFDWYVDQLLPKVVGFCNWGPNQKFHGHVSTYTQPDSDELYIHKNAEAYIQLIIENCEVKWDYCIRRMQQGKEINTKSKKWNNTLYSSSRSGHNMFGGWNDAGRVRFAKLQELIGK